MRDITYHRRFGYILDISVRVRLYAGHISEGSDMCGSYPSEGSVIMYESNPRVPIPPPG